MSWSFWKGVLVGVGGLLVLSFFLNLWGWVPWLLLAGGAYVGYRQLRGNKPPQLGDPASKARQIADEVERRIDELGRKR